MSEKSEFDQAVAYVQKLPPKGKVSNASKLAFYAFYKQASIGPVNEPPPSRLKIVDRAKWEAWKKLNTMTKEEAKRKYVEELTKVDPKWKINNSQLRSKL